MAQSPAALAEARAVLATVDSTPFVDERHASELARALAAVRARFPEVRHVRQPAGGELALAVWVRPEALPWAARVPIGAGRDTVVPRLGVPGLDTLGRRLRVRHYAVSNFNAEGIVVTPVFRRAPGLMALAALYRAQPEVERVTVGHDVLGGTSAVFLRRTAQELILTFWDGTAHDSAGVPEVERRAFIYDRRTGTVRRAAP